MEQKNNITVFINEQEVSAPAGSTVLEAAQIAGVRIPTLCYFKEINEIGACRICVVAIEGVRNLVAACVHPVAEGMKISTRSPEVIESRRRTMKLLLSTHDKKCLSCVRSSNCELQELSQELGIEDENYFAGAMEEYELDYSAPHLIRDNNKCILCRRCAAICENQQAVGVIGANNRGFKTYIGSAFDMGLGNTSCVTCGQCIMVCPVGALYEKDYTDDVLAAIADPTKHVVVQTAPAIRTALGEEFGYPIGTNTEGKMVSALRRIGFDSVFDTSFGADTTIMEESAEFLSRMDKGGKLPLFTSCCPSWVKFCEHYYPDLVEHLSSCKSPTQMLGSVIKTYYAEKKGIAPKDIVSVNVMPCTAKKYERTRENQAAAGVSDVDISITTRELARLIRRMGIDFHRLPDDTFDNPNGQSASGIIFGATGGVMEAALRTVVEKTTGEKLADVNFTAVRGTAGIKEAGYNIAGNEIKVAIASGLDHAKQVLDRIRAGETTYHFVEVMGCWGGCVNGGGQPLCSAETRSHVDIKALRAKVLYEIDAGKSCRKSHENPSIIKLYGEYFGEPGSEKAHEILHTSYVKRTVNSSVNINE